MREGESQRQRTEQRCVAKKRANKVNPTAKNIRLIICTVCAAALLAVLGPLGGAWAQPAPTTLMQKDSPFAEMPKDSWVYSALSTLVEHHALSESPSGGEGRFPPWSKGYLLTRYETAVWLARLMEKRYSMTEKPIKSENVRERLNDLTLVRKLTAEFSVEFRTLGVNMPVALRQLDDLEQKARAAEPPFPDVPPTHWASTSIERLRRAGILVGYPDGSFLSEPHC